MAARVSGSQGPRRPRFFYGWVIVVVVALASFTHSVETYAVFSVFLKPMTQEFGWTRTSFTLPIALGSVLGGFLALSVGPLLDRFGPRWLLSVALGLTGGTLVFMAWVGSLWQYVTLQTLGRVVSGGIFSVSNAAMIPKWFVAKRGRAMGAAGLGGRIGSTVTPLYAQLLVGLAGWRVAIATTGGAVWVLAMIPAAIFLRRQPEDLGLLPDGAQRGSPGQPVSAHHNPRREDAVGEASLSRPQVVRLRSFYLLTVAVSLTWLARTGFSLHMMPFLTDRGLTPGVAVILVAVHSASGALGGVVAGLLAERLGVRLVMTVASVLTGGAFLLVLPIQSTLAFFVWGAGYGLVHSGLITLQHIVYADYYGRRHVGAIQGLVQVPQTAAMAVGPLAAAMAYDVTKSYSLIFLAFGACVLVSALCVFLARAPAPSAPLMAQPRA